jgi:hypothetical protein
MEPSIGSYQSELRNKLNVYNTINYRVLTKFNYQNYNVHKTLGLDNVSNNRLKKIYAHVSRYYFI